MFGDKMWYRRVTSALSCCAISWGQFFFFFLCEGLSLEMCGNLIRKKEVCNVTKSADKFQQV